MAPSQRVACQLLWRQRAFERDPLSVRAAREFTATTLTRWEIPERGDDIHLCASELATNALLHSGDEAGFLVVISAPGDRVRLEVRDTGAGMPHAKAPEETSTAGRGLLLVAAYADDWGVETEPDDPLCTKSVWAEFKAGPTRNPGPTPG